MGETVAQDIEKELRIVQSTGWNESTVSAHERCDRIWFRHFAGEPECIHNEGKRMQIRLRMWDHRKHGHEAVGFDMTIIACPPGDNGWCEFMIYGLTAKDIEPNIDRLLKAWRAVQK